MNTTNEAFNESVDIDSNTRLCWGNISVEVDATPGHAPIEVTLKFKSNFLKEPIIIISLNPKETTGYGYVVYSHKATLKDLRILGNVSVPGHARTGDMVVVSYLAIGIPVDKAGKNR